MANMFTNYDNDVKSLPCEPCFHHIPLKDSRIITNIKGEMIGVQVNHASPLQLYFHLENIEGLNSEDSFATVLQGSTLFEVLTTTGKVLVKREYMTAEILDQYTYDLYVTLTQEEMKMLKKETYAMRVTLKTANSEYEVFAEKDGYLIVR
jgi:hypothetical protein